MAAFATKHGKSSMRVGILGSGLMGSKLGTIFARAGHEVVFSYARSKEKLQQLARDAGANARAGTPGEAAAQADALLLAVHWSRFDDVLKRAGDLAGKAVVTCSLPMADDNSGLVVGLASSGAEKLAKMLPKARVVCAFNTVPSEVLFDVYEAQTQSHAAEPGVLRRRFGQQARRRGADPRHRLRSGRRRTPAHCALHRAVRAARRRTCIPWTTRTGTGVPVRAVLEIGEIAAIRTGGTSKARY
jgi:predicted dinucleotide-binding enzyme